ncbi:hypothetical protein E2C01_095508 [Portunus trituberculatus]|uniref:Uncharacterized protein n=1 Tax=Portunus trituberculatus TaxID=210409 RepID=A0A5B7JZ15_PORTR|nr:hypothetical protein [Portunus trituberculatus]
MVLIHLGAFLHRSEVEVRATAEDHGRVFTCEAANGLGVASNTTLVLDVIRECTANFLLLTNSATHTCHLPSLLFLLYFFVFVVVCVIFFCLFFIYSSLSSSSSSFSSLSYCFLYLFFLFIVVCDFFFVSSSSILPYSPPRPTFLPEVIVFFFSFSPPHLQFSSLFCITFLFRFPPLSLISPFRYSFHLCTSSPPPPPPLPLHVLVLLRSLPNLPSSIRQSHAHANSILRYCFHLGRHFPRIGLSLPPSIPSPHQQPISRPPS